MLNRTNRTLSASSDRLNLGTRSLAVTVSNLNVVSTLRAAFAHPHDFMRTDSLRGGGMAGIGIKPPMIMGYRCPSSVPSSPGVAVVGSARRWVEVVAEQPPVEQEVIPTVPAWPTGRSGGLPQQPRWQTRAGTTACAKRAAAAGHATPSSPTARCAAGG